MKKALKYNLFLLTFFSLFNSCSSDEKTQPEKLIKYESDLIGHWKLVGISKGKDDTDISTDCQKEKGSFFFGQDGISEKRGIGSIPNCSQENYTYESFNVIGIGDVIVYNSNIEYKYHASYKGNILYFARYSIKINQNNPDIIKTEDLKYYHLKKIN